MEAWPTVPHISSLTKYQNCEQDGKNRWQSSFRTGDRNASVVESASIDLETGGLDAALAIISVCNRNPRLHDRETVISGYGYCYYADETASSDICFVGGIVAPSDPV